MKRKLIYAFILFCGFNALSFAGNKNLCSQYNCCSTRAERTVTEEKMVDDSPLLSPTIPAMPRILL